MSKKIKVIQKRTEDDNYNELWQEYNEKRYYARHVYAGQGIWCYVSDPFGYCELDYPVPNDVIFIVCDKDGNELFESSNADKTAFPTLEEVIKKRWKEVGKKYKHITENFDKHFWSMMWDGTHTLNLNKWLLTFKDKKIYKEADDYDENWCGCWHNQEIDYKLIPDSEFEYLGVKYEFVEVKHKHDHCGMEWTEFVCTKANYTDYIDTLGSDRNFLRYVMYLGAYFDSSMQGTMYDKATAREKILKILVATYPKKEKWSKLLFVDETNDKNSYYEAYCSELTYQELADMLSKDLHKEVINHLCNKIKNMELNIFSKNKANKEKIKEKYHGNVLGYDYCLL